MFFYGNIEALNREQHNDRLRRIEHDRLVSKAGMTNTLPGLWHRLHRAVYKKLQIIWLARGKARLPEQIKSPPTVANQG